MLGKLIKLDFKFGYKKFIGMAGLMLVFGLVGPYLEDIVAGQGLTMVFMVCMVAMAVLCISLIIRQYRNNLFGDEGYLMHTLPVKSWQLVFSKLTTSVVWFNLIMASAAGMSLLLARTSRDISALLEFIFQSENIRVIWEIALELNLIALTAILGIYMGIALSTVAVKNKSIGNFGGLCIGAAAVIACNWAVIKSVDFLTESYAKSKGLIDVYGNVNWTNAVENMQMLYLSIGYILFAALFFFVTVVVIKRKLNLK